MVTASWFSRRWTIAERIIVRTRALVTSFACIALALVAACSLPRDRDKEWVASVQSAHEQADESARDPGATELALRKALSEAPSDPDARQRWVIQDLYYRLAQTLLDADGLDPAAREVAAGLAIDRAPTLARANLLALQGKIAERRGDRRAAAEALHEALLINEWLMDRALAGANEEPPKP